MAGVDFTYTVGLDAQTDALTKKVNAFRESIAGRPFNIKLDLQGFDTEKATQAFAQLGIEMDKIKTVTADVVTLVDKNGKIYQEAKGYTAQYTDELGRMVTAYMKIPTTIGDTAKKTKEYDAILKSTADTLNRTQNVDEKHRLGIEKTADEIKNSISSWKQLAEQYGASSPQAKELETKITGLVGTLRQQEGATKTAANAMQNFGTRMANAIKQTFAYGLSMRAMRLAQMQLNEAIKYTIDLNTEMTKIQVLQVESAKTAGEIDRLAQSFNDLAIQLGATTLAVAEGSVEWLRQGKTINETTQLLEASTMLSKLGALSAGEATDYLTSTMNSYKMETEDAISVVDKLVQVDNISATSTKELATALKYSAATAAQAGVEFEQLVSYIATISSTTRQNAESIGQGFKTMFARMQDIKAGKIDEDGLGLNNVESALTRVNIALRDTPTSFRDMSSVLEDVAAKWSTLNEVEQANISKAIAGVRQQNLFMVLMQNMSKALEYQTEQYNASGTALNRYGIYLDSIEAKQQIFKATLESIYMDADFQDIIKQVIDLGIELLEVVKNFGGIERVLKLIVPVYASYLLLMKTDLANTTAKIIVSKINATLTERQILLTHGVSNATRLATANTLKQIWATLTHNIVLLKAQAAQVGWTTAIWGTVAASSALTSVITFGIALIPTLIAIFATGKDTVDEFSTEIDKAANSIQEANEKISENRDKVESTIRLYGEFNNLLKEDNKSAEQYERLFEIQNKLKEILPELIGYYDAEGNFIATDMQQVKLLVEALNAEILAKQTLAKLSAEENAGTKGEELGQAYIEWQASQKRANESPDDTQLQSTANQLFADYQLLLSSMYGQYQLMGEGAAGSFIIGFESAISNADEDIIPEAEKLAESLSKVFGSKTTKPKYSDYTLGIPDYATTTSTKEATENGRAAGEAWINAYTEALNEKASEVNVIEYLTEGDLSEKINSISTYFEKLNEAKEKLSETGFLPEKDVEELRSLGVNVLYAADGTITLKESSDDLAGAFIEQIELKNHLSEAGKEAIRNAFEEAEANYEIKEAVEELADATDIAISKTSSLVSAMEEQGNQGYISADTALQIARSNGELFRSLEEVEGGYRLTQDAVNAQIQSLQNSMNSIFAEAAAGVYGADVKRVMKDISVAAAQGNYALAISAIESAEAALTEVEAFGYLIEILERLADIDLAMPTFTGAGGYSGSGGSGGSSARQEDPRIAQNEEIIDQYEDQIDAHEDIIDLHEDEIELIDDEIELLEDQIDEIEDVIEVYEDEIEIQEDIIKEHQKIIDAHEKDIDLLELEIDKYEEKKNAIEEARDIYHQWIDDKKESLELAKAESDYYSEQDKKVKDLAKIQQEIAVLSLDTSEEGRAKRLKLEEQAAGMQTGIEEDSGERRHQLELQALENLRTSYDEIADKEIERFDNLISGVESQITLIEEAIGILNGYIEEAELIITYLETQIDGQKDVIEGVRDQIKAQNELKEGVQDLIDIQRDKIEDIRELIEDVRDIIADIRKENKPGSGSGGSGGYSGYNGTGNSDAEGGTPGAVIGYDKDNNPYYLSGDGTIIQGSYSQGTHKGINSVDIGGKLGDAVGAATGGELIATGEDSAHGKWLVVRGENGMDMRYYHLTDEDIAEAERKLASGDTQVTMGETIGHIGDTGNTAGNHYGLEVGIFQASFEDAMAAGLNMTEKEIEVMNRINSGMIPTAEAREWLTEVQDDVKDQDRIIALSADGVAKEIDITNKITETGLKTVKDGIDAGVLETNSVFDGGKITLEQALADNKITTQEAALLGIEANERFLNDNTLSLQQAMADGNISMEEALELGLLGVTTAAAADTENLKQGLIAGTITLGDAIGEDMVTLQGALADGVLDITEQEALGANAVTTALADGFISAEEAERLGFFNTGEKLDALTLVTAEGKEVTFTLTTNDDGEVGFQYTVPETTVPPTSDLPPIVKPGKGRPGGQTAYHTGGFAGGLESNEIFAKLLKGEYVATEKQMDNFLKNVLPSIGANMPKYSNRYGSQNITVNMPITVEGNMDKTVIPQLDEISNKVIDNINKALVTRGYVRSANISLS